MSFYHLPHPWDPGYAIPDYVKAEPPERGVFTTKWLPRGTIPTVVPDFLAKPVMGLGETVYELTPMGNDLPIARPIAVYGQRAGEWIANTILGVPLAFRKAALRALLDTLDKSLWSKVSARMESAVARGVAPRQAMREALATSMSEGVLKELEEAGRRGQVAQMSQLGLGMYANAASLAQYHALDRFYELGGLWDKFVEAVKSPFQVLAGQGDVLSPGVKRQVAETGRWVKKAAETVASLACDAADSIAGAAPAVAATGMIGAAAAGAVTVTQTVCGKPTLPPPPSPPPATPAWVLPAAIGGGVLVLALALRR